MASASRCECQPLRSPHIVTGAGTSPAAIILVKDKQAEYLGIQEEGGTRYPKRNSIPVPFNTRLNKFGNMPRTSIRRMLSRSDTFTGTIRGQAGVWQRKKDGGLNLLVAFETKTHYRARFGFADRVKRVVNVMAQRRFNQALRKAMASARK